MITSKCLKGQLGPCVSNGSLFGPKKVSWGAALVTAYPLPHNPARPIEGASVIELSEALGRVAAGSFIKFTLRPLIL